MNNYFVPLNFFDPRDEILNEDIEKVRHLTGHHPFLKATNFTIPNSIFKLFDSLNLEISLTKTFLMKLDPFDNGPIHRDGSEKTGNLRPHAFNWAWGASNTTMEWFDFSNRLEFKDYNDSKIPFYDPNKMTLKFKTVLAGANLVNIMFPHRVVNHTPELRISLSVGIANNSLAWDELVNTVKTHNLVK
jgi:hypothetical protein